VLLAAERRKNFGRFNRKYAIMWDPAAARIFSPVHPRALSLRNSSPPKSASTAAATLTFSDWQKPHERFTLQYEQFMPIYEYKHIVEPSLNFLPTQPDVQDDGD
jgi:hypothetical protein